MSSYNGVLQIKNVTMLVSYSIIRYFCEAEIQCLETILKYILFRKLGFPIWQNKMPFTGTYFPVHERRKFSICIWKFQDPFPVIRVIPLPYLMVPLRFELSCKNWQPFCQSIRSQLSFLWIYFHRMWHNTHLCQRCSYHNSSCI